MAGAVTRQHSSVRRFRELARNPAANGLDRELLLDGALRLPIAKAGTDEALHACARAGMQTLALAPRAGAPFFAADFHVSTALLLGSEGTGLPPGIAERADRRISIPMQRPVESLN